MKKNNMKTDEKTYFFDKPKNIKIILYAFCTLCAILFAADFVLHRHTYHEWEKIPAFYALFGFISYVIIVFTSAGLRKLIMRPEDYYEPQEDTQNE